MVFVRLDFPNTIFLVGNVNQDRVFNVQWPSTHLQS
jgi:hypothetical protein